MTNAAPSYHGYRFPRPFAGRTPIHVVQNWFAELQARVPTGR